MNVLKGLAMKERRRIPRTCCSLDAEFSFDRQTFKGRIENMSNFGAIVQASDPSHIREGKNIRLAITCDGKEDVLEATVVWSESGSFGAKFNQRPTG